ncbi:MAG: hypothetical protein WC637_05850 [Victivallales bacterium]
MRNNRETPFPKSSIDYTAKSVWISKSLYDLIHEIKEGKGGNLSSLVEELIVCGIKHHGILEECRSCAIANQDGISELSDLDEAMM